jgi:predicted nucleotidyltransferase
MIELAIEVRQELVERLVAGLTAAANGSFVLLYGSLAEGRADAYSDIDLIWDIPDPQFEDCIKRLPLILELIQPVASVRNDPDFQRSDRRRIFFVRFKDLPLFWRLDLQVFARSVSRDPAYDLDNPAAHGSDWSHAESALANVVAAIKAYLRGHDFDARELIRRGFLRVGGSTPDVGLLDAMIQLVCQCIREEPRLAVYGVEVIVLARHGMTDANS